MCFCAGACGFIAFSTASLLSVMTMMGAISNCVGVLDDVLNGLASVS